MQIRPFHCGEDYLIFNKILNINFFLKIKAVGKILKMDHCIIKESKLSLNSHPKSNTGAVISHRTFIEMTAENIMNSEQLIIVFLVHIIFKVKHSDELFSIYVGNQFNQFSGKQLYNSSNICKI